MIPPSNNITATTRTRLNNTNINSIRYMDAESESDSDNNDYDSNEFYEDDYIPPIPPPRRKITLMTFKADIHDNTIRTLKKSSLPPIKEECEFQFENNSKRRKSI